MNEEQIGLEEELNQAHHLSLLLSPHHHSLSFSFSIFIHDPPFQFFLISSLRSNPGKALMKPKMIQKVEMEPPFCFTHCLINYFSFNLFNDFHLLWWLLLFSRKQMTESKRLSYNNLLSFSSGIFKNFIIYV